MNTLEGAREIACVMVTYNSGSGLANHVSGFLEQFTKLIIVDNGSEPQTKIELQLIERAGIAEIICLEKNHGIAHALNVGVKRAMSLGFSWVMTLDQDSTPAKAMISRMSSFINKENAVGRQPLILTPRLILDRARGGNIAKPNRTVGWCITSGNLIHVSVFEAIGFFDEGFFIDSVDFDFALRARAANFKIYQVNVALLEHNLGERHERRLLGLLTVVFRTHSPIRRYYAVRNHFFLLRRHGRQFPYLCLKKTVFLLIEILQIALLEDDKSKKLWMAYSGFVDFCRKRMGPIDEWQQINHI